VADPKFEDAQSRALADAQREDQGKRHLVSEAEMQSFVDQLTNYAWHEVKEMVEMYDAFLNDPRRALLTYTGLDGIAIEIAASVSGSATLGLDFTPLGASIFFPLRTGVSDNTSPHPVRDAPHYFLFSSIGFDIGGSAGASASADVQVVFADHWEKKKDITVDSWGGTIISVDAEAGIYLGLGGELVGTLYFTSVQPSAAVPGYGAALSEVLPDKGWHGAGVGGQIGVGAEVEFSIGVTLTTTLNSWLDRLMTRPDVRKAMENPTEIPEAGEFHYQEPSDPISQFVSWLADSSSGVGEAMQE
jgi:hypothetical protein